MLCVLRDVVEAGDVQAELLGLRELAERRAEADQLLPRHPRRQLRLRSRRCGGCNALPLPRCAYGKGSGRARVGSEPALR